MPQVPSADPLALLDAFLHAHASATAVPLTLMAKGQELHDRLVANPPKDPRWGRFLVAMGHLAVEHLEDPAAAGRFFQSCLQQANDHGDHEAAVTAGYDLGVLMERSGKLAHARGAYRAAAIEGFRLRSVTANTVRSAQAAIRLFFAEHGSLDDVQAALAKQSWLAWLYLRLTQPQTIDHGLEQELTRSLCAFLLPEEDPAALAQRWREWRPKLISTVEGPWRDGDPRCLVELFAAAAQAADSHLSDEGPDPGAPYRMLFAAAQRSLPAHDTIAK